MTIIWLLLRWWRARQRQIDLRLLWPICKREAQARFDESEWLDHAKAAFAVHAFHDEAWIILGESEIVARIEELR